jgi:alpha-L-fucosidase
MGGGGERGVAEWIMENKKIPIVQYKKLPAFFNPIDFDPEEWVSMAKESGMKYITITSKHHDGFAMYDSKVSGYNIVDSSPYGKDVLKMLAEECHRQGIKLFLLFTARLASSRLLSKGKNRPTLYRPVRKWGF